MQTKTDDIDNLADRLQFVAASIKEPWSDHVFSAALRLKEMAAAGDRMARILDLVLAGDYHTSTEIVDVLAEWEQA